MLVTERVINSSFIMIVFGLLGAVFGLMETIGKVMHLVEPRIEHVQEKIEKLKKIKQVEESVVQLQQNFCLPEKRYEKRMNSCERVEIRPTNLDELDATGQNA